MDLSDNYYLSIIPDPYSPEDYQELEDEIMGAPDLIFSWTYTNKENNYDDIVPIDAEISWHEYDRSQQEYLDPCGSCSNNNNSCHCTEPSFNGVLYESTHRISKTRY